uniref:(California timema) hypothetical protein n=1 Tax=Timema californicum TaxID=61474 RepID=A0A7R9JIE8_TIMCA|nr:unnamed protein product [Timema californicum]
MDQNDMKVMTERSSDDSVSLYMGINRIALKQCVLQSKLNLSLLGINTSRSKTFFFREGLGEYTSWYMDKKFVSQYGVETASLRPQGKNPPDDFYALAKGTATALSTLTINPVGASARLRIGIDARRGLWRTRYDLGKRENISGQVQLLSDGGQQPWQCMNCYIEESVLKERHVQTMEEANYLKRIRNPENSFSQEPKEEITFSNEHGTLMLEEIETLRTCFHFLKKIDASNADLNEEESNLLQRALDVLEKGDYSLLREEEEDSMFGYGLGEDVEKL